MNRTMTLCALVAASLIALAGCAPSSSSSYVGTWTSDRPAGTELQLKDGGDLSGNDGCNAMSGQWTESKGTITFSKLAVTTKACLDIDPWLSKAATARSDGDTLNVYDSAGTQVGVLDKK